MCVTDTSRSRQGTVSFNPSEVPVAPFDPTESFQSQYLSQFFDHLEPTRPASKPKRRRAPQKPGLTAKNQERHFVQHDYHDHSRDGPQLNAPRCRKRAGGPAGSFPSKLHMVLDQVERDGFASIISWQPHGRCFVIHKPKAFVDFIMPKYVAKSHFRRISHLTHLRYYKQSKLTSFQRQLNLYGFQRVTRGRDAGGYYNEFFLRGRVDLCANMSRTKIKGTRYKAASSPDQEPDFYSMPPFVTETQPSGSIAPVAVEPVAPPPAPTSNAPSLNAPWTVPQPSLLNLPSVAPVAPVNNSVVVSAPPSDVENHSCEGNSKGDDVLDGIVDDLFLKGDCPQDALEDFLFEWDPDRHFEEELEKDEALSFMMDKLLEE